MARQELYAWWWMRGIETVWEAHHLVLGEHEDGKIGPPWPDGAVAETMVSVGPTSQGDAPTV